MQADVSMTCRRRSCRVEKIHTFSNAKLPSKSKFSLTASFKDHARFESSGRGNIDLTSIKLGYWLDPHHQISILTATILTLSNVHTARTSFIRGRRCWNAQDHAWLARVPLCRASAIQNGHPDISQVMALSIPRSLEKLPKISVVLLQQASSSSPSVSLPTHESGRLNDPRAKPDRYNLDEMGGSLR